jgi:TRAP transporter TAXI family solute receptor
MEERIMKKVVSLVIALVLALSCTAALAELTFTTGGTSGTYYAFGNVLAQYITNNSDVQVTAVSGNGSADNIDKLDLEDAQLGFVQNDVANYAYNGIRFEQYEGKPINSFTALCALYTETVQLVTCNPDIKSVEDLKGKNVSIGSAGSGVYFNAMDFLAAYDMTEADINPQYLSFGDSAESLKDGKIDAAFVVAGAPTTAITELSTSKPAKLVPLDDEHVDALLKASPYYSKAVIPAGTYDGQDADVTTVAVGAVILAADTVSEDAVYALCADIFDNAADLTENHAKYAEVSLEKGASITSVPYHPGAAKYFNEKGQKVTAK